MGSQCGHALADLLTGKANPSGKLPCVYPKDESQLPYYEREAREIEYGLYHGYRLMDKNGWEPAFPFGFGLSYTTYRCRGLELDCRQAGPGDVVTASVEVTNEAQWQVMRSSSFT